MTSDNDQFDRDDALNFMVIEDIENKIKKKPSNTGCLRLLFLIILPTVMLVQYFCT